MRVGNNGDARTIGRYAPGWAIRGIRAYPSDSLSETLHGVEIIENSKILFLSVDNTMRRRRVRAPKFRAAVRRLFQDLCGRPTRNGSSH